MCTLIHAVSVCIAEGTLKKTRSSHFCHIEKKKKTHTARFFPLRVVRLAASQKRTCLKQQRGEKGPHASANGADPPEEEEVVRLTTLLPPTNL